MSPISILWVDDEIDLLQSLVMFLENKGYHIKQATNGRDAVERCKDEIFDIVFLDENMPGLSGLETLGMIKAAQPNLPTVMITKSEEENIMDEAIGGQITDYLIKPVKPQQILLTIKKIIDNKRLVQEKTATAYQQEFQKIFMAIQEEQDFTGWVDIYKKLVYWELNLIESETGQMNEVFAMQKSEANKEFCKFIIRNYEAWINKQIDAPVMSHTLMQKNVIPLLGSDKPTFLFLIDNLRYDQWRIIEPLIATLYRSEQEDLLFSILPTCTQYSRNAIFSGMMPLDIQHQFPKYWIFDDEDEGKNRYEEQLLADLLARNRLTLKHKYVKITHYDAGLEFEHQVSNYLQNNLNVIVYNFVDTMSHARTEKGIVRELANDEAAYRSITQSWFKHSPLWAALKKLAEKNVRVIITTDHGTIRVGTPSKVVGDRNTSTNLRYKTGKNLRYEHKDVFEVNKPESIKLPRQHISSKYIFAKEDRYFVYHNNYNHFVKYFDNTFQHGGISMEEMLIPFIVLRPK